MKEVVSRRIVSARERSLKKKKKKKRERKKEKGEVADLRKISNAIFLYKR